MPDVLYQFDNEYIGSRGHCRHVSPFQIDTLEAAATKLPKAACLNKCNRPFPRAPLAKSHGAPEFPNFFRVDFACRRPAARYHLLILTPFSRSGAHPSEVFCRSKNFPTTEKSASIAYKSTMPKGIVTMAGTHPVVQGTNRISRT